jgi:hypothetical protein
MDDSDRSIAKSAFRYFEDVAFEWFLAFEIENSTRYAPQVVEGPTKDDS